MKKYLKKVEKFIVDPQARFAYLTFLGLYNRMSDKEFLRKAFRINLNKELNLDNPQSFNEKLQWLKLYDRKPQYTVMVDKLKVRDYIAERIGEQYLIPLLGVWDDPDEIDFDSLPNQFVLKCNHNSGLGMCICKDKTQLDIKKVKKDLKKGLEQNYYLTSREWPYKNVPRKIICEKYMVDGDKVDLEDYKVHNFNGKPKMILVCSNRFTESGLHEDFYDTNWKRMNLKRPEHPCTREGIKPPVNLNEMLALAETLSSQIPFLRTDFYEINGKLFFGELTFYPGSGLSKYSPEEWDNKIGRWLQLPDSKFFRDER